MIDLELWNHPFYQPFIGGHFFEWLLLGYSAPLGFSLWLWS
jgi:hypothetical protein